jgi:hypothetical protein
MHISAFMPFWYSRQEMRRIKGELFVDYHGSKLGLNKTHKNDSDQFYEFY